MNSEKRQVVILKLKGIDKTLSKFNNWPATARIYLDTANGRVWCETFVNPHEGRFQKRAAKGVPC